MAYVDVERMPVRAHWSLVRSVDTDDALGGRDKLRRSSDRGGRAGLRACALSRLEIAESVREGRVVAPGVSVTAHLPTIEHIHGHNCNNQRPIDRAMRTHQLRLVSPGM
ncbi:uncharacterized protein LOC143184153 [Calliopsis andreniformis]|uniref:uncharacterized protein LOC143184153 n=1 Tax=Calliopsis andreniformis TaxID=337506 RepID=UPI003FCE93A6